MRKTPVNIIPYILVNLEGWNEELLNLTNF